jgi:hypothetical protein
VEHVESADVDCSRCSGVEPPQPTSLDTPQAMATTQLARDTTRMIDPSLLLLLRAPRARVHQIANRPSEGNR